MKQDEMELFSHKTRKIMKTHDVARELGLFPDLNSCRTPKFSSVEEYRAVEIEKKKYNSIHN